MLEKQKKMFNKKAQIGETMTWVVATIIIIVILGIAIFASSFYNSSSKKINIYNSKDVLISKSFFSYLLTPQSSNSNVYDTLKSNGGLDKGTETLAKEIFSPMLGKDYPPSKSWGMGTWVGANPQPSLNYIGSTNFPESFSIEYENMTLNGKESIRVFFVKNA